MDVSIIIVHYNTTTELEACLSSIKTYLTKQVYEVLVIDNCSSDLKIRSLALKYPWAKFYFMEENLGFSKANNYGAKYSTGEYLLFLNPDTLLKEDCLSPLLEFLRSNQHAGICAPMLVYNDGSYQNSCGARLGLFYEFAEAFMIINAYRKITSGKFRNSNPKESYKVGWVSGAFLLIVKNIFEKVNGFSEEYFLNYEDIDLCRKIEDSDKGIYYFPKLKCIHLDQTSQKKDYSAFVYNRYVSRLIFAQVHYGLFKRLIVRIFHIEGLILRLLFVNMFYKGSERSKRLDGYLKSFRLYLGMELNDK